MSYKFWVFSDIHLRAGEIARHFLPLTLPKTKIRAAIVAGDVADNYEQAINWLAKVIRPHMPVIYVLGNHEFYGGIHPLVRSKAKRLAEAEGITLLDDDVAVVEGIRYLGGTLWTDFQLYEKQDLPTSADKAMAIARRSMDDFTKIYANEAADNVTARFLSPQDTVGFHRQTVGFIRSILQQEFDGPTIVVTHHAPHRFSLHPRFHNDPLSAAFVSDLSNLFELKPDMWIHGHVHDHWHYMVGDTIVRCHPLGYHRPDIDTQAFPSAAVIELNSNKWKADPTS